MSKFEECVKENDLYLIWTKMGHYICKIDGATPETVTLRTVYKLILSSMIPVRCIDVLVLKREEIFILYKIGSGEKCLMK